MWYLTALGRCCAGRWRRRRARTPLRRACATALGQVSTAAVCGLRGALAAARSFHARSGVSICYKLSLQALWSAPIVSTQQPRAAERRAPQGARTPWRAPPLVRERPRHGGGKPPATARCAPLAPQGLVEGGHACDSCERAPRRRRRRLLPGGGYAGRGSRHSAPAAWLRALHSTKAQDAGGGPEDS